MSVKTVGCSLCTSLPNAWKIERMMSTIDQACYTHQPKRNIELEQHHQQPVRTGTASLSDLACKG
jgi:hypothetical protein